MSNRPLVSMDDVRSIGIVVHGVGDHTPTDILKAAENGLRRTVPEESVQTNRLEILNFPLPDGRLGPQQVLDIRAGVHRHLIIPVVWSRIRSRAGAAIEDHPDLFGGSSVRRFQILVMRTFRPLLALCVDAFCCVARGSSITWKLGLMVSAFAVLGLVAALTIGLGYYLNFLPFVFQVCDESRRFACPGYLAIVVIIPASIIVVFRRAMPLLDFVGDVAFYVGRPNRRQEIEARMLGIIQHVAERAPQARILVVGHSLGTVLVTHALLALPSPGGRGDGLLLVTLGSPLRLMSRAFAGRVLSPTELLARYANSGTVAFWAHMWRDSDWIGRALLGSTHEGFGEAPLGAGVHTNYWSDGRLWAKVIALMDTAETRNFADLAETWRRGDIDPKDVPEAQVLYKRTRFFTFWAYLALGFLGFIAPDAFGAALGYRNPARTVLAIRALWLTNLVVLIPLAISGALFGFNRCQSERELLGRLRLTSGPLATCFWLWIVSGVALGFLRVFFAS